MTTAPDAPPETEKPEGPLEAFLWGAALPFGLVIVCTLIAVAWKAYSGWGDELRPKAFMEAAAMGATIGCVLAIVGVLDMIGSLLFSGGRFVSGLTGALGYLIGWAVLILCVLTFWGLWG